MGEHVDISAESRGDAGGRGRGFRPAGGVTACERPRRDRGRRVRRRSVGPVDGVRTDRIADRGAGPFGGCDRRLGRAQTGAEASCRKTSSVSRSVPGFVGKNGAIRRVGASLEAIRDERRVSTHRASESLDASLPDGRSTVERVNVVVGVSSSTVRPARLLTVLLCLRLGHLLVRGAGPVSQRIPSVAGSPLTGRFELIETAGGTVPGG